MPSTSPVRSTTPLAGRRPRVPPRAPVRVLVVDDDPAFRQLMTMLLTGRSGLDLAGACEDAAAARERCGEGDVQAVVVDWKLGGDDGVVLGSSLRDTSPGLRMLLLTAHPTAELPARLLAAGFLGYVDKDAPVDRLLQAVEAVAQGEFFFASRVVPAMQVAGTAGWMPPEVDPGEARRLAPRQRQVATLVADGLMSKEIAARLNLSLRTVEKHRATILQRLGLRDTASLTRWCLRAGLVK